MLHLFDFHTYVSVTKPCSFYLNHAFNAHLFD